jgi:hypothetical protein
MANERRCEVSESTGLKIGSGWRVPGGPIWLLDSVEGDDVVLARWRAGVGGALLREERRERESLLLGSGDWRPVPQAEVDSLVEGLMNADAADQLYAVRQRAREQGVADEGRTVDRERLEARQEAAAGRREGREVPALDKTLWSAGKTTLGDMAAELRARGADVSPVVTDHGEPVPEATPPTDAEAEAIKCSPLFRDMMDAPMAELARLRQVALAENMRDLGELMAGISERMIYEARELRRLAGVSDDDTSEG